MNRQKTADQTLMRELNTSIVMDNIRLHAPLSRAELAARTGLNRSTISLIVNALIDQGIVQETNLQDPKIGRPGMLLQFNPEGGFAIGVEIGVDFISVILTNFVAEILWRRREMVPEGEEQILIMERAEQMIGEAVQYGQERGLRPLGIGVGVPGLVDTHQGKLVFAPNLKWVDMPVRLIWMRRFNLPVFVENEANCAAMGEYFYGKAHDAHDFIYLKTGVGLGGGIMIGGKLFRGADGYAGEIGHITLYNNGQPCGCGRVGCWETYVRPSAVVEHARKHILAGEASLICELVSGDLARISMDTIVTAAEKGDVLAKTILEDAGTHLGVGIANLINIFNPELVVLGGVLSEASPWLIPVIQKTLASNILPPLRENIHIEVSAQGLDACVLGAVALVLDDILREPLLAL